MPLSTNWRTQILGFVSTLFFSEKDGDSINVGDEVNPKKLPSDVSFSASETNQVRSGYYTDGNVVVNGGTTLYFIGDGDVTIDAGAFPRFVSHNSANQRVHYAFLRLKNSNFGQEIGNGNSGSTVNYCTVDNCTIFLVGVLFPDPIILNDFQRNLIKNTIIKATFAANRVDFSMFRCTFIASIIDINIDRLITFSKCAIDKGCSLNQYANREFTFNNCALEDDGASGFLIEGSRIQNLTLDGDGGTIGATYSDGEKFTGTISLGDRTYNIIMCFWAADLGFSNKDIGDYTIANTSSPIWNNANSIGALELGFQDLPSLNAYDPVNGAVIGAEINRDTILEKFELIAPNIQGAYQSTLDPKFALRFGSNGNIVLKTINEKAYTFGNIPPLEVVQLTKYDAISLNPTVRRDREVNVGDMSKYSLYTAVQDDGGGNARFVSPNENIEIGDVVYLGNDTGHDYSGVAHTVTAVNTGVSFDTDQPYVATATGEHIVYLGWKRIEDNMPYEVDSLGLGNGDQDADLSAITPLQMDIWAERVTLRNDGN